MLFLPLDLVCWYFLVKHSLSFQDFYLVGEFLILFLLCLPNFIWYFKDILLYLTELLYIYFKILCQAFHPFWFLWNLLLKRDILLDMVHVCPYTEVSVSRGSDHCSFQRSSKRFSPDDVSDVSVQSARHLALFPVGQCTVACLQLSWLRITTGHCMCRVRVTDYCGLCELRLPLAA